MSGDMLTKALEIKDLSQQTTYQITAWPSRKGVNLERLLEDRQGKRPHRPQDVQKPMKMHVREHELCSCSRTNLCENMNYVHVLAQTCART